MNQAMFQRNGRCGYVLKPEALRKTDNIDLISKRTQHFLDVMIISGQQLPRLRDSDGKEIIGSSLVDPFVEISLHVPEWTSSPFLLESTKVTGVMSSSSSATANAASYSRTLSVHTTVVKNNGFNPTWRENFSIPFDCIGNMTELIFVEFTVRHHNRDLLGMYCTPLSCIGRGYHHIPLHESAMLSPLLFSTLFVKIGIRDLDG